MPLSDHLPSGARRDKICVAGQSIDALSDEHRSEYEAWVEARKGATRTYSAPEMAIMISGASGIRASDKTLLRHLNRLCICYESF